MFQNPGTLFQDAGTLCVGRGGGRQHGPHGLWEAAGKPPSRKNASKINNTSGSRALGRHEALLVGPVANIFYKLKLGLLQLALKVNATCLGL